MVAAARAMVNYLSFLVILLDCTLLLAIGVVVALDLGSDGVDDGDEMKYYSITKLKTNLDETLPEQVGSVVSTNLDETSSLPPLFRCHQYNERCGGHC